MAGQLKVDSINADSNLTLRIANTAVAFIDSNGLRPSSGNVSLDATGTTGIRSPSANTLVFYEGGVEAMRIDSSGNVGIGTASPAQKLDVASKVQINTSNSYGRINIARATDSALALYIQGADNAGTDNELSLVNAGGGGAAINITGGDLRFYATSNTTERMRIDTSGTLLIGKTATGLSTAGVYFVKDGQSALTAATGQTTVYISNVGAGSQAYVEFRVNAGATTTGTITTNGTGTTYGTASDYRLKENIVPMTGALAKVQALKPCTYTWKLNNSSGQGFIAHELQEVVPDCVTGEKDALDVEGKPVYQGVDTSFLVATLTAAIQELKEIVDAQATEIAALKAK